MVISHDGWIGKLARGTRGVVRLECSVGARRPSTVVCSLPVPTAKITGEPSDAVLRYEWL